MNRNWLIALGYAFVPLATMGFAIFWGISGPPLQACFITSLAAGVVVGLVIHRQLLGGAPYSGWVKTVMFILLGLTMTSVVWGLWAKDAPPIAQQPQPPAGQGPGGVDGKGKVIVEKKILGDGIDEAFEQGKEEGKKVAGQGQSDQQSYTVSTKAVSKGWGIEKDNRGNAEITFSIPGAPAVLETGLWCRGGEAFYVSTHSRHIPGFQAGFAENKKFSPGLAPAWEYAQPQGCRTRFDENDPKHKIELAFYTAAIPEGHYRVSVRHSGVALHPLEFQPGVPLARVYGY